MFNTKKQTKKTKKQNKKKKKKKNTHTHTHTELHRCFNVMHYYCFSEPNQPGTSSTYLEEDETDMQTEWAHRIWSDPVPSTSKKGKLVAQEDVSRGPLQERRRRNMMTVRNLGKVKRHETWKRKTLTMSAALKRPKKRPKAVSILCLIY